MLITMLSGLCACGREEEKGSVLVYGSGDYTRMNPAMDEHGEMDF